jgi:hypothetical protein
MVQIVLMAVVNPGWFTAVPVFLALPKAQLASVAMPMT